MSVTQKYRKQLIRMALFSTPLIGLYFATPIFLFIQTLPAAEQFIWQGGLLRVLVFIFTISTGIFFIWNMNLFLLNKWEQRVTDIFRNKEYERYIASFVILITFSIPTAIFLDAYRPIDVGTFKYYPVIGLIGINSFVLLLMDLIIKQNEAATLKLEKAELEITQLISQQEQLKQQIHPHFLFNALGTLRALIKKNPLEADLYTSRLAKFLRASLSLAQQDLVTIQEEIDFLENYFNLQKMRFSDGIQLVIDIPNEIRSTNKIPVFTLQILAENAIKHNAFSLAEPLQLHIEYLSTGFLLIRNNTAAKYSKSVSTGIGLQNLKLRFSYFTEALPEIIQDENFYQIKIKVLSNWVEMYRKYKTIYSKNCLSTSSKYEVFQPWITTRGTCGKFHRCSLSRPWRGRTLARNFKYKKFNHVVIGKHARHISADSICGYSWLIHSVNPCRM